MKNLFFSIFLLSIPFSLCAQTDYYIKDHTMTGGIDLIDGGDISNSMVCQVKNGNSVDKYSPNQISEYGFKDGRTYKSFQIKTNDYLNSYFLEIVVSGKLNLYCFKGENISTRYFLLKNDSNILIEIPQAKNEYRALLKKVFWNSIEAKNEVPYIHFNYYNLKKVFTNYNHNNQRLLPRFHYGFVIGRTASQFTVVGSKNLYSIPQINRKWNFTVGAFMDLPICSSGFSFHPEMYIKRNNITLSYDTIYNNSYDVFINNKSLSIPLLFRYTIRQKDNCPFVEIGPIYSQAIINKNSIYAYRMDSNAVTITNITHKNIFQNINGGISIGIGVLANINNKYAIVSEFRYNSFAKKLNVITLNELSFNFGIEF